MSPDISFSSMIIRAIHIKRTDQGFHISIRCVANLNLTEMKLILINEWIIMYIFNFIKTQWFISYRPIFFCLNFLYVNSILDEILEFLFKLFFFYFLNFRWSAKLSWLWQHRSTKNSLTKRTTGSSLECLTWWTTNTHNETSTKYPWIDNSWLEISLLNSL